MDRRLWLCDKWNAQYQAGGVTQTDLSRPCPQHERLFKLPSEVLQLAAQADLDLLSGYQKNNDIASIQTKLSEYKGWWNRNKGRAITLP